MFARGPYISILNKINKNKNNKNKNNKNKNNKNKINKNKNNKNNNNNSKVRLTGSDGIMSAGGPKFDVLPGRKFYYEHLNLGARRAGDVRLLVARLRI